MAGKYDARPPLDPLWTTSGSPLDHIWFAAGQGNMMQDPLWTPSGPHLDPLWTPSGPHLVCCRAGKYDARPPLGNVMRDPRARRARDGDSSTRHRCVARAFLTASTCRKSCKLTCQHRLSSAQCYDNGRVFSVARIESLQLTASKS
eukprot:1195991-Prorocentrum_minimum.AAC.5